MPDDRNGRAAQWIDADFDKPEELPDDGTEVMPDGVSFQLRLRALVAAVLTCVGLSIMADSAFGIGAVAAAVAVGFVVLLAVVP